MASNVHLANRMTSENEATRELIEKVHSEFKAYVKAEQSKTRSNYKLWATSATSIIVALMGFLALGWRDYTSGQCREQAAEVARVQSMASLDEARSVARREGSEAGERRALELLARSGIALVKPLEVSR